MSAAAGSLEVLRAAERTFVPWKNGGGFTREVVVSPAGSDLTAFDWRISIAEIRTPGPFSLFEGIDRLMAVLAGRLSLAIDGRPAITLTPESDAVAFSGDLPVVGAPLGAAVTDLNVMTRRSRCAARLTRSRAPELAPQADTSVIIAPADLTFRGAGTELSLLALDALVIRRLPGEPLAVHCGSAPYYLIEISERPA